MVFFEHVLTDDSGLVPYMTGMTDLLVSGSGTAPRLYSVSGSGLATREASNLATLDYEAFAPSPALDAPRQMLSADLNGGPVLLSYGHYGLEISVLSLDAAGQVASTGSLQLAGADIEPMSMLSLQKIELDGHSFFVSSARQTAGLQVWEQTAYDTLTARGSAVFPANDVMATASVTLGGLPYILALSLEDNSLTSLRLQADGTLTRTGKLDPYDGLAIATPTQLALAQVAGESYALVGASGSSSISVVALGPDGTMQMTDQVIDDLPTRFQSLSVLKTTELNGQTYVIAAGADDGLTLMTLLPGGRLVALASIADDTNMALSNPADIAMVAGDGGLDIFVAGAVDAAPGEADHAITKLHVALGEIGQTEKLADGQTNATGGAGRDQLIGNALDNSLAGGGGDDVLFDGAGSDTLAGGAGSDLFVLTLDATTDHIVDFEPGIDRLDLSLLGRFYSLSAIEITQEGSATRLSVGDEDLLISTADGSALAPGDLEIDTLLDLWHISVTPVPIEDPALDGDDLVTGAMGTDFLLGGGGNDFLIGDVSADGFDSLSGKVFRLYHATLARAPDVAGLLQWVNTLEAGATSMVDIASGFVDSLEFQTLYGETDTTEFVTLLYNNVLGRAPDAVGLAHWSDKLDSGSLTRPEVVLGFSESLEFQRNTEVGTLFYSQAGLRASYSDDVFRLYQATLGRLPDAAGFDSWTAHLANDRSYSEVVHGFVASAEFQSSYAALDDEAFVTLLYQNVLDRSPDAAGLADWTGRLSSGALTREQVVAGFAQSAEFISKTALPLRDWLVTRQGGDTLNGGTGQNVLYGGYLADTFIFDADTPGQNTIVDFEPWDSLHFEDFGYASAEDVISHMTEQGGNVVFLDQETEVLILNVGLDAISLDMITV